MATLSRRAALGLVAALAACHSPADDYDRFIGATAEARKAMPPIADSHYEDLNGTWLVNALLAGGLGLGLRMHFTVDTSQMPRPLIAQIWTTSADPKVDPPLIVVTSAVQDDGRFELRAEPLDLKQGSVKGLNIDVKANVIMDCYTQSPDEWCGGASGKVVDPLELDLTGSTLGALRDDAGEHTIADVPNRCPSAM